MRLLIKYPASFIDNMEGKLGQLRRQAITRDRGWRSGARSDGKMARSARKYQNAVMMTKECFVFWKSVKNG
jgi:hypothetical protein